MDKMTYLKQKGAMLREWNYKIIGFEYQKDDCPADKIRKIEDTINKLKPLYQEALSKLQVASRDPETEWALNKKELEEKFAKLKKAVNSAFLELYPLT